MRADRNEDAAITLATGFLVALAALLACFPMRALCAGGDWPMWRRDRTASGFQPTPGAIIRRPREAWSCDLGGWEALVVLWPTTTGKPHKLTLAAGKQVHPATWDKTRSAWGLGEMRYDLAGDGKLITMPPQYNRKVGKLLAGVKGLQQVRIIPGRAAYGEQTDTGVVICTSYENGADKPRQAWKATAVRKTHRPLVALADVDGDGDLDVVHSDWGALSAHDGATGKLIAKVHWLDYRHRGLLIAKDIDGDKRAEFVVIGMFHMNVSVVGNSPAGLKVLWSRLYEPKIEVQDRIVRAPRNCLADLDGDGRFEFAYNLIDMRKDRAWHVMIHDAVSGKLLADLPQRYLDSLADIDGDGRAELFLSQSNSLSLPADRPLHLASLEAGRLTQRWHGRGRLHQRFDPRAGHNVAEQLPFHDVVTGDVDGDGRDEFFVSSPRGVCTAYGCDATGQIAPRLTVLGPADVLAAGKAGVLLRCRISQTPTALTSTGCRSELASLRRRAPPGLVGPPVVADLGGDGRPVVLVPKAWSHIAAIRPPGRVLWQRTGRAMSIIYQRDHGGVLAADLTGNGQKEVIFAAEGPATGAAAIQAVTAAGQPLWHRDLPQIQWSPTRGWGPGAIRTWTVGQFRKRGQLDVYASAHINEMHSGTSYLLDGRTGRRVWDRLCLTGRVKEAGGGHVSVADLDADGLDDIAGGYCNFLFTLDGQTGAVKTSTQTAPLFHPVMPGSWINSSTPVLVDVDSKRAILLARQRNVTALLDPAGKRIRWWRGSTRPIAVMPGLADVDGDGRLEIASVGSARNGDGVSLWCADLATGRLKWEMTLPTAHATDFATCDIDGRGPAEFLFASDRTLYAVNGQGGKPNVLWKLPLPARIGPPIAADVDADGRCEILLITHDGHLRCIDGRR